MAVHSNAVDFFAGFLSFLQRTAIFFHKELHIVMVVSFMPTLPQVTARTRSVNTSRIARFRDSSSTALCMAQGNDHHV